MSAIPWQPYSQLNVNATGAVPVARQAFLGGLLLSNSHSAVVYVKVYNKATAATNADTPILRVMVPVGGTVSPGSLIPDGGLQFRSGVSIRATTGVADNDNTSPPSNTVIANLFYR